MWRHHREDFESKKETPPLIEDVYRAAADSTGLTGPLDWSDRSSRNSWVFKSPSPVRGGRVSRVLFGFSFPFPLLQVRARVSNAKEG